MKNKKLKKFLNTDKTFFIAEIGINHNASLKLQKNLSSQQNLQGVMQSNFKKEIL